MAGLKDSKLKFYFYLCATIHLCSVIKDILSSEEYSLDGVAYYTDTHVDIIQELYSGRNINPSAKLLRKIIELHHSIRRDLYNMIMKKVAVEYLKVA